MTKQQAIVWLQKAIEKDYCLIELPYNLVAGVIELLAKAPEWVSVKDKLPANCDNTLVAHSQGVTIAWFDGFRWTHGAASKHRTIKTVSHWMPLPNPPED